MQTITKTAAWLCAVGLLLFTLVPQVGAQPTIDGASGDADYELLAEWTQANTGFGDHGMKALYAYQDGNNLYVMIEGEAEDNGNTFLLFIDISSQSGVAAGTAIPRGTDDLSPLNQYSGTVHDFETDYAVRIGSTTSNGSNVAFTSIADYTSLTSQGRANEEFLAGPNSDNSFPADGTSVMFSTTSYAGTMMAYDHVGNLSSVTNEGWEFSIPLSSLGWASGDTFQLFALYTSGSGDFVSANTLPEIAGQSGTSLGGNPDFTAISGDQHTAPSVLPVELTDFRAQLDGSDAVLTWRTLSETNNDRFEVQHSAAGAPFRTVGSVEGMGTTTQATSYSFRLDDLGPGSHSFRLRQVDVDGTPSLSGIERVEVGASGLIVRSTGENPVRSATTFKVGVEQTSPVRVELYNVLGQRVQTLFDDTITQGPMQQVTVNASTLPSGAYFVRTTSAFGQNVQRITVVR